jgi:hypothetical protein
MVKKLDSAKIIRKPEDKEKPLSAKQLRILDGISEAVEEINLHKKGIKKMQSGDAFLEELRREGYL